MVLLVARIVAVGIVSVFVGVVSVLVGVLVVGIVVPLGKNVRRNELLKRIRSGRCLRKRRGVICFVLIISRILCRGETRAKRYSQCKGCKCGV